MHLSDPENRDVVEYKLKQGTVTYTNQVNNVHQVKIDGQTVKFDLHTWANTLTHDVKALKKYRSSSASNEYAIAYDLPVGQMQLTQYAGGHTITLKIDQANLFKDIKTKKYELNFATAVLLIKW